MGVSIGKEKIGDLYVEIEVESSGKFAATIEEEEYSADTKADLIEKLRKAYKRRQKVDPVEITLLDYDQEWQETPSYQKAKRFPGRREGEDPEDGYHTHATLRGKNPRTRQLLVTINEKKDTLDYSYRGTPIARRLSEPELVEFRRLKQAIRDAKAAYDAWYQSVKFDVDGWLKPAEQDEP